MHAEIQRGKLHLFQEWILGLKNKDVCLPFSEQPKKSENKGQLFFLFSILHL